MRYISWLDYARFLAALAVMGFHYLYSGIVNEKVTTLGHSEPVVAFAKYGYLGVEFFFMISGYVIFYSAECRSASAFITARALRLFPAFWAAVLITSVCSQFWGVGDLRVSALQFLANLTMFPKWFDQPLVDGVYWTLRYEWTFYIGIFLIIFAFGSKVVRPALIVWPAYIACVYFFFQRGLPLANGYYAYFAAGSLFAILREHKSAAAYAMLVVAGVVCFHFSFDNAGAMSVRSGRDFSLVVVAGLICVMFLFFGLLSIPYVRAMKLPLSKTLGAITYPLYLVHAHLGFMLLSKYADEHRKWLAYFLVAVAMIFLAYLINKIVEVWAALLWRSLFKRVVFEPSDYSQRKLRDLFQFLIVRCVR